MLMPELIHNSIQPLRPTDPVQVALDRFEDFRVAHLPVVDIDHYVGMVSEEQMLAADTNLTVGDVMGKMSHGPKFNPERHILDSLPLFALFRISLLPVVTEHGIYLGCLYANEILNHFGGIESFSIPGGVVVLNVNKSDYHLTELAHLVESDNAKILALFVQQSSDPNYLDITLRISKSDLTRLIETLKRYDYTVKHIFHESRFDEDMRGRYESFIKYLNI